MQITRTKEKDTEGTKRIYKLKAEEQAKTDLSGQRKLNSNSATGEPADLARKAHLRPKGRSRIRFHVWG